jgi:CheY-like chemotaxis protein
VSRADAGAFEVGGTMAPTLTRPYAILITDDDRDAREALRSIVEPEGFRTYQAASGEEALDIVHRQRIHLALFDMHMPTLTGLETLQLVRQYDQRLPCILVTADATAALLRQALLAHAYSVIPKPVSKHVVLYTVVSALGRAYGGPAQEGDEGKAESQE